ncbi:hypothetical protein GCM10028895_17160 [Pontibacter rugosus]
MPGSQSYYRSTGYVSDAAPANTKDGQADYRILAYSLSGHHNLPKKVLEMHTLIHQVISSLDVPPSFKFEISENLPVLYSQEVYLFQIFSNLIGNAIKFHDQPENAVVTVSCSILDEWLTFIIKDNGPGIPVQVQKQIFHMYDTGSALHRSDSTGLGLSIVRKLVEEKGGKVWVESTGRGSSFILTWPASEIVVEEQ